MMSGDGIWRRCHPIFAVFIGDFPEQSLVMCTYTSRCPKCLVPSGELGDNSTFPPCDYNEALNTYKLCSGEARVFNARCREVGLKPMFHPFWEILPFTDIFVSITPDILHQLLQGLVKHTVGWLVAGFGSAAIDALLRFFLSALLHADTSDCLLSSLPHPLIGPLYFYDTICLLSCTILIWRCDAISRVRYISTSHSYDY